MTILHLMVGLPCSGKTTLAKQLEVEFEALRLTPDEWHRHLYGQDATHPEHNDRHEKIESLQWQVAVSALARGLDVILDFGLWTRIERQNFKRLAADLGAETKIHFLDVPFTELLKRLESRNLLASDEVTYIPLSLMHDYLSTFEAPGAQELAADG